MEEGNKRYSHEAERAYIGACMVNDERSKKALQHGLDRLGNGEALYRDDHRLLWQTFVELAENDERVNAVTVAEHLSGDKLARIGGSEFLSECIRNCPSVGDYESYLDIIEDKYIRRSIEKAQEEVDPYDPELNPEELAEEQIDRLVQVQNKNGQATIENISSGVSELVPKLEEAEETGLMEGAVRTGLPKLTKRINGIMDTDFVILSGESGLGKTTLGLQITDFVADEENKNCLVYSGEMHGYELAMKLIAKIADITLDDMMQGNMGDRQWERFSNAVARLNERGIFTMRQSNPTLLDFKGAVRKAVNEYDVEFVLYDYIQMTQNHRPNSLDERQFYEVLSSKLNDFANTMEIPILGVSRLSRAGNIHGAGQFDYDCNYHLNLVDPCPEDDEDNRAVLKLEKTRFGKDKDIRLIFEGEYSRFFQADKYEEDTKKTPANDEKLRREAF